MSEQKIREIVSVDLGSTNSQMGHKYVDIETGKAVKWNDEDYTKNLINDIPDNKYDTNIPTVLLKWIGNEASKPYWDRKIPAGKEVAAIARQCFSSDVEIIREFKKELFFSEEEKLNNLEKAKKNEKAQEYVKEFFSFLKEVKGRNIANAIIPLETETVITVPARSKNSDMAIIEEKAKEAGWSNITIRDEARSALDYAIYKPGSELLAGIKNSTVNDIIHVLLVDVGGSTTDILHAEISPDGEGGYTCDYKSQWPSLGETDTLGGIDVDKAVADLMIDKGYLIETLAKEEIENYGYAKFRKFKELWSDKAKNNDFVPGYDELDSLACDMKSRKFADVFYDELEDSQKLGRDRFIELIKGYVEKLQLALRKVLFADNTNEQDLDYIVLAGGGSSMYGIDEMILGELDIDNPLDFSKIKENPNALIHGEEKNPSAVCCLGNLFDKTEIKCRNHINGNYLVEVEVYTNDANVLANFTGISKKNKSGKANIPKNSKHQYTFNFKLAEDLQALPINKKAEFEKKISIVTGENILFRITVYRQETGSEDKMIECSWLYKSMRTMSKWVFDGLRNFLSGAQENIVTLKNTVYGEIDENRKISIRTFYSAEGFYSNEETTKI